MPGANYTSRRGNRRSKSTKSRKPIFKSMNASALVAKKRRSNLIKTIKDINISMAERKYKSRNVASGGMFHNQIYQFHIWGQSGTVLDCMPNVGTTDGHRIGDRIYLDGFMLRASFSIAGDRRNTVLAIYYVPHNSDVGNPSNDLFHNVTGSTQIDPVQKKRYPKAIKLGTFRVPPSTQWYLGSNNVVSENTGTITVNKYIKCNKKVFFNADADNIPTNINEYGTLCICPYQNWKTLATDEVVTGGDINVTAYFRDI